MKRQFPGLHLESQNGDGLLEGLFLVRVDQACYKSQLPVIERALEMAARMLGSDHSRSYCLEMICADFLAGSTLDAEQSEGALLALGRLYSLLPEGQKVKFTELLRKAS